MPDFGLFILALLLLGLGFFAGYCHGRNKVEPPADDHDPYSRI